MTWLRQRSSEQGQRLPIGDQEGASQLVVQMGVEGDAEGVKDSRMQIVRATWKLIRMRAQLIR